MRYLLILCLLLGGCTATLKTGKPFVIQNLTDAQLKSKENIEISNTFFDNRCFIFRALVDTPCFLESSGIVTNKTWAYWLENYGKDDIDGFISWVKDEILYGYSGGQFLNEYFKQVKLVHEVIKDEK